MMIPAEQVIGVAGLEEALSDPLAHHTGANGFALPVERGLIQP
jgi:hypothetical protein